MTGQPGPIGSLLLITGGAGFDVATLVNAALTGTIRSRPGPVALIRYDGSGLTGATLTLVGEAVAARTGGVSAARTGTVLREVHRTGRRDPETTVLALAHPCLACAVREDLAGCLDAVAVGGIRSVAVILPPGMDAGPARAALRAATSRWDLRQVTVRDGATWDTDATGDEVLSDRGWQLYPGDDTGVSDALLRQLEGADFIVATGPETAAAASLRRRLAPGAARLTVGGGANLIDGLAAAAQCEPATVTGRALLRAKYDDTLGDRGFVIVPPARDEPAVVLWRARAPLHPERLQQVLPELVDLSLRTYGCLWLPRRPADRVALDHAGIGLRLQRAGRWVAAEGPEAWLALGDAERAWCDKRWSLRYGDRRHELVAILRYGCDHTDAARLLELFESCLLADDDAQRPIDWAAHMPDPFQSHLGEPGEAVA